MFHIFPYIHEYWMVNLMLKEAPLQLEKSMKFRLMRLEYKKKKKKQLRKNTHFWISRFTFHGYFRKVGIFLIKIWRQPGIQSLYSPDWVTLISSKKRSFVESIITNGSSSISWTWFKSIRLHHAQSILSATRER